MRQRRPRPYGPHYTAPVVSPTPAKGSPKSLSGLLPFLPPYRGRILLARLLLLLACGINQVVADLGA